MRLANDNPVGAPVSGPRWGVVSVGSTGGKRALGECLHLELEDRRKLRPAQVGLR